MENFQAGHEGDQNNLTEYGPQSTSTWRIIYPNYIDSCKTIHEGRRIARGRSVETPLVEEMKNICDYLQIPCFSEVKAYSRDWLVRGRLRIKLQKDDGSFFCESIHTKKSLMLKMGELIPQLKTRAASKSNAAKAKSSATSTKSIKSKQNKKRNR